MFNTPTTTTALAPSATLVQPVANESPLTRIQRELCDKSSAQYALRAVFYNRSRVPQSKLASSGAVYPPFVELAMRNNPDPDRLVPVVVAGFDGLRARAAEQAAQAETNRRTLAGARAYLDEVEHDVTMTTEATLPSLLRGYAVLRKRLLGIVVRLEVLRAYAGVAHVSAREQAVQAALEDLVRAVSDPVQCRARLEDLEVQTRTLCAARAAPARPTDVAAADVAAFSGYLEHEQRALARLVESVRDCEQLSAALAGALRTADTDGPARPLPML